MGRIAFLSLALASLLGVSPAETIPVVHGSSLAGNPINLPADLSGRNAVIVIGFSRDSQGSVRDWGRRLAVDYHDSRSVGYYELAVLAAVPRLARGLVVRAIKKDVSQAGQTHFLPITEGEADWRRVTHYSQPDFAYVLLVDGAGQVRWTTSGPLTESAYGELKKRLTP